MMGNGQIVPFFMVDLSNFQMITTRAIPQGTIKDTKRVLISETPVPGRNFSPISTGANANRKIAFTLPLVNRGDFGNLLLLKQFDGLRNQSNGIGGYRVFTGALSPNPKVLFQWGTGSVPLIWFVTKCDFAHESGMVNRVAFPQHTLVDVELTLDEENILYKGEELFRSATALLGTGAPLTFTEF